MEKTMRFLLISGLLAPCLLLIGCPAPGQTAPAARWRTDAVKTVSGYSCPWFTKGDSASGSTTCYNDNANGGGEPGKSANDLVAVYGYYWNGSWISTAVTGTAPVKSKATGANSLGIYDMSGNVWEICFDLYTDGSTNYHLICDGSWGYPADCLQIGNAGITEPHGKSDNMGVRLARTAP